MRRFHLLALAAIVSVPIMMSGAAPAVADQEIAPPVAKPVTLRHQAWYYARRSVARIRQPTRVAALPVYAGCNGAWCGRNFVLMLGIGF